MSLKEPEEANAEGLRFWKKKNKEVFLFHSILRKVWKEISFFQNKKSVFFFQYTSSISTKNFKKILFQSIEFKTNFF